MCKYNIFDSHAHYDDERFDIDREDIFNFIEHSNIVGVLNCGSSMDGVRKTVEFAKSQRKFYGAVGIHPQNAEEYTKENKSEILSYINESKILAIGEIGLDYYYENSEREIQKKVFIDQMEIADENKLPVIIHSRDAHKDTLEIIQKFPNTTGVLHCFSGDVELCKKYLNLGYKIGFTGVVTFKNAKKILEVVKMIPLDSLLLETDCPYMSPEPYRGKRNESKYVVEIITKIAEIKGISPETLSAVAIANTKNLLKL